jgi:hypothetical protein
MHKFIALLQVLYDYMFRAYAPIFRSNSICNSSKMVFCKNKEKTEFVRYCVEVYVPLLHVRALGAAVANIITPEDGRIRPKNVVIQHLQ